MMIDSAQSIINLLYDIEREKKIAADAQNSLN